MAKDMQGLAILNVKIPTELHKELKIKSVMTGRTITELTTEYVARGLAEDKAKEQADE